MDIENRFKNSCPFNWVASNITEIGFETFQEAASEIVDVNHPELISDDEWREVANLTDNLTTSNILTPQEQSSGRYMNISHLHNEL